MPFNFLFPVQISWESEIPNLSFLITELRRVSETLGLFFKMPKFRFDNHEDLNFLDGSV